VADTVVATDVEQGIRLLELSRPERLNAISPQLLETCTRSWRASPTTARVGWSC
jgi:enoyl-CoA hydratase/carnithine racemase